MKPTDTSVIDVLEAPQDALAGYGFVLGLYLKFTFSGQAMPTKI